MKKWVASFKAGMAGMIQPMAAHGRFFGWIRFFLV
jgi:hypothetical protein